MLSAGGDIAQNADLSAWLVFKAIERRVHVVCVTNAELNEILPPRKLTFIQREKSGMFCAGVCLTILHWSVKISL